MNHLRVIILLCMGANELARCAPGDTLWTRTYGGAGAEHGYAVCQTADGGFAIAGSTESFGAGGSDFWLVRTDADGDTLWTKTYGSVGDEECRAMVPTADGGYALVGSTTSFSQPSGVHDLYLVKADSAGKPEWTEWYHHPDYHLYAWSLLQTDDMGYVICGSAATHSGIIYVCATLRKVGPTGAPDWFRTYLPSLSLIAAGNDVLATGDGGYAIGGLARLASVDAYLVKTDSSGAFSWDGMFGGSGDDACLSLLQTEDQGYLLAGSSAVEGNGTDAALLKVAPSGTTTEWTRLYGGAGDDAFADLCPVGALGSIAAGMTESFGGDADVYVVRMDASGDTLWTRPWGGTAEDLGHAVIQATDGGFVIAGATESWGAGASDFFLLKLEGDPLAPMALSIDLLDPGTARLSWSPVFGATHYDIYRSVMPFFPTAGIPWATVEAPTIDLDVTEGVGDPALDYFYRGRSRNAAQVSEESAIVGEEDFATPCP